MPHCTKCGALIAENAAHCGSCGAAQSSAAPASGAQPQMAENVASTLAYALGWVTGLIFFFIDKRPTVQFHAKQSIIVFGALHIVSLIIGTFLGASLFTGGVAGFSAGLAILRLIQLVGVVLWILLMVKAYQGERFRVPFAADLAEQLFGKS
ncbi:MAG TPA: DUF4870 domain-containing protein [Candidatus Sulfotelmatobacter sp.]|nr:DUF4870 domain-containing protein [Candidatus Sulfotelmatobacter sp.]